MQGHLARRVEVRLDHQVARLVRVRVRVRVKVRVRVGVRVRIRVGVRVRVRVRVSHQVARHLGEAGDVLQLVEVQQAVGSLGKG